MTKKNDDKLVLLIVILFWFAQYIAVPFLSPHLIALGITASFAGVIMGAYGMAQLVLRIPISVTEDMNGRHKAFIMAGLAVLGLASFLPILSSSPIVYLLSRTLTGVAASTWVSYTAAYTQNVPNVKQRMGQLIAANNLGVMLSYIAGGLLFQAAGMNALFLTSSSCALLAFLLAAIWKPQKTFIRKPFKSADFLLVIRNRHLWRCALMTALGQLVLFATSSSFVSNYAKLVGAGSLMISLIAIAFNAMGTITSWAYAQGIFKHLQERWQLVIAFGIMALYCMLLPICSAPWHIAVVQLLGGAGRSVMYTLLMAVAPAEIPAEAKTTATGVFQSVYSLGMTAGPMVMGRMLDASGSYGFSFIAMGAISLLGVLWVLLRYRRNAAEN